MIENITIAILLTVGAILMLLAGIGILRMPDVLLRISATTKAATLGVIFIMIAVALHFGNLGVTSRAVGVIIFITLTAPISAHMISRAAYITGDPLWSNTKIDELRGRYNKETYTLESQPSETVESI